jgi:hypothetical protein
VDPPFAVITQANSRQESRKLFLRKQFVRKKVGVCLPEWRNLVYGVVIVVLPASLMAQDSGRALLHSDGGVWLNGNPAPNSSAIFPHDLVQTQKENSAKIDADGSAVTVQADTIVQFDGDELVFDHGSLQLNTSRGMKVRVNCLTVIPVTPERTQYDVTDVDGKVKVVAYKNDVTIHYQGAVTRKSKHPASLDVIVREGEQASREERCGAPIRPTEVIDAKGAILNSVWAKGAGVAAIGIFTCVGLCHGDDPVSPYKP